MTQQLTDLAAQLRPIVDRAVADLGPDLQGYSVIDLCVDNSSASIADIKAALVVSGADVVLSPRLIRTYSK